MRPDPAVSLKYRNPCRFLPSPLLFGNEGNGSGTPRTATGRGGGLWDATGRLADHMQLLPWPSVSRHCQPLSSWFWHLGEPEAVNCFSAPLASSPELRPSSKPGSTTPRSGAACPGLPLPLTFDRTRERQPTPTAWLNSFNRPLMTSSLAASPANPQARASTEITHSRTCTSAAAASIRT